MAGSFYVKAKAPQYKHFMFVTSRGGLSRLRVYAASFRDEETAQKTIELNAAIRPDWQFKVEAA